MTTNIVSRVTVNYDRTVEELIGDGKYDWANNKITSAHFPSYDKGTAQMYIFLLGFDSDISSKDAIRAMYSQDLRPATLKELLALGAVHPDLQRENPIVALGSGWYNPGGNLCVPDLGRLGSLRCLDLYWFPSVWNPFWRFAAVHK